MSDIELEELVRLFKPSLVFRLPNVGHGFAVAAHYAGFYQRRMQLYRQEASINKLL